MTALVDFFGTGAGGLILPALAVVAVIAYLERGWRAKQ